MDMYIYLTLYSVNGKYNLRTHGVFTNIDHVLNHKEHICKVIYI